MKRRTALAGKRAAKRQAMRSQRERSMRNPGGNSRYGRKRAYLNSHGGWGWEYPEPKPWK